jgi:hypothetical protein
VIPQIKKEPETYDPDGLIVIGDWSMGTLLV